LFWLLFLSIVGTVIFIPIMSILGEIIKIGGLEVVPMLLPFVLAFVVFGVMEILKKMDKENDIQVLKVSGNSVTLPMSADNEIKKTFDE
ncbi:hypothetical protein J6A64_02185, partial [bacterium]|nr:hypothetical protein [bacterium]